MNIVKKIKNNTIDNRKNKGVALLFAIMVTGILFAVALGTTNIAFRETVFGTSAKSANEAFFAADTGSECALFYDKTPDIFPKAGVSSVVSDVTCIDGKKSPLKCDGNGFCEFVVFGLSDLNSCAKITVEKYETTDPISGDTILNTKIISKGYNLGDKECNSTNQNRVERELELDY